MGSLPFRRRNQPHRTGRPFHECCRVGAATDPPKRSGKTAGCVARPGFRKKRSLSRGTMSVAQAVAFVERIKERTGKYPGLYCSEYRLRQMLYGPGATSAHRQTLANCWLWIANYHAEPRNTAPWRIWRMWQYCGDGKCNLRPRSLFPKSVANIRKAERNIFRGDNAALQAFWRENAWYPSG